MQVTVGGQSPCPVSGGGVGGFNGGGNGGSGGFVGLGGGGASDVRSGATRLPTGSSLPAVAAARAARVPHGGVGGGLIGGTTLGGFGGAGGGTQSEGGFSFCSDPGSLGLGGNGASGDPGAGGGGGGDGYWGGGGGGSEGSQCGPGGGAGGSGFIAPGATGTSMNSGVRVGNGLVTITYAEPFVGYSFTGFFSPVDNLPALNAVKGGASVPVKFSLAGDQGLDIFAVG